MSDILVTRDGELMVAQVEGVTDDGDRFVDAYLDAEMHVVDSTRIIVPYAGLERLLEAAKGRGLTIEEAHVG